MCTAPGGLLKAPLFFLEASWNRLHGFSTAKITKNDGFCQCDFRECSHKVALLLILVSVPFTNKFSQAIPAIALIGSKHPPADWLIVNP
jgi:hypothetical protein